MARTIDFSKPLTADDQKYVEDRPWLIEDARLRGEEVVFEEDSEFVVDQDDTTEQDTDDETSTEGDEDESEEGDEDDAEEAAPYTEWDYADLKEEAGNRNLSKSGSKEQLIQRLEENDASSPE